MTHQVSSDDAIRTQGLSKTYGQIQALRDVSFSVPKGTVFGILGPNGAGKTTLLRILTTITRPDSGDAWIEGYDILSQVAAVRQLIGVVAQENHFDRYLSIWHNLTLHAQMHGLARPDYEQRITALLQKVGLYDRRFSLPDQLSGGMQRRIALIRALIHQPKILFLDEPTTGLDPQARLEIWRTIEQFKRSATVILTTHYMEEADRLSDRILMLHHGQVVAEGTPQALKLTLSPTDCYELVLKTPKAKVYAETLTHASRQEGSKLRHIQVFNDHRLEFEITAPEGLQEILAQVASQDLLRLGQVEAELEDVFLSIASSKATEGKL